VGGPAVMGDRAYTAGDFVPLRANASQLAAEPRSQRGVVGGPEFDDEVHAGRRYADEGHRQQSNVQ
jgi:hypothetical protein